ncbi:hypothetical protein [Thermococcus pacificus]|uniref:Uncharacterized protein n=1 Tax=Thermococcus pacificus TaxID=71998 RepID=A0A218P5Z4_9EURY|nr:hypothetical protein [Thermococcus pacificus]ASJ06202.1 hypothetical protein A3L08_02085 [Thermococcus pacificus]
MFRRGEGRLGGAGISELRKSAELRTDGLFLWLPLLILFRLGFRFVTLIDPVLGMVFFYNAPLMLHLPRFFILSYPLIMGIAEVYFMVILRKGKLPFDLLFAYFMAAIVFEFPYSLLKSGDSGLILFALVWYATAPAGLPISLHSPWKIP